MAIITKEEKLRFLGPRVAGITVYPVSNSRSPGQVIRILVLALLQIIRAAELQGYQLAQSVFPACDVYCNGNDVRIRSQLHRRDPEVVQKRPNERVEGDQSPTLDDLLGDRS